MSSIRKRQATRLAGALAACAAVLGAALAVRAQAPVAQAVPDNYAAHAAPEQPIPYSHRTHAALGLTCDTCHTGGATGAAAMGFPETTTCMSCHSSVAADRPSIRRLTEFHAAGEAVPWARVYEVLPGVTWSHAPHVAAGVDCGACHGRVAEVDTMAMTTSVTAMASCIACHETRSASTACATCHAWPAR